MSVYLNTISFGLKHLLVVSSINFFDMQEKSHKSKQLFFSNDIKADGILPCICVYTEEVDRDTCDKFQNKSKIKPFQPHRNAFFILKQRFIKTHNFKECSHFYIVTSFSHRKKHMLLQKCSYSAKDQNN